METLINRLHRYSKQCVADRLDSDFASAVQEAADVIEGLQAEYESIERALMEAYELVLEKEQKMMLRGFGDV